MLLIIDINIHIYIDNFIINDSNNFLDIFTNNRITSIILPIELLQRNLITQGFV